MERVKEIEKNELILARALGITVHELYDQAQTDPVLAKLIDLHVREE